MPSCLERKIETFSKVQRMVFSQACSFRTCHSTAGHKGNLVLESGKAYGNLVNVEPDNASARERLKKRVIPGNPQGSFIMDKLEARLESDEGDPMPQNLGMLSQDEIDLVRGWIQRGAPND